MLKHLAPEQPPDSQIADSIGESWQRLEEDGQSADPVEKFWPRPTEAGQTAWERFGHVVLLLVVFLVTVLGLYLQWRRG